MASAPAIVRRALLYVPSSSQKMLTKSLSLTTDNVTYDLEDSVTLSQKPSARSALRDFLSHRPSTPAIRETAVRINAVETRLALEDLNAIFPSLSSVDAIVIPKVNSAADLKFVDDVLRHLAPSRQTEGSGKAIKLLALIESAKSVMDLSSICTASKNLSGLIFAAEDFAHDLSITRTPSLREFLYARSAIATAARAYNIPSTIDLVCTSFRGEEGLRRLEEECQDGKELGFNGKQCIHPSQVAVVQNAFAPRKEELQWSVRVCIADEKAGERGKGAWTLDGKMIDVPVVRKAKRLVERARECGVEVDEVWNKWKDQEPE